MYSAIILSVYGVISKLSRFSSLLIVPSSDLIANTLNLVELVGATFLFCLNNKEFHMFGMTRLAFGEVFVLLILHCVEGAKICAMFCPLLNIMQS